jgi:hypothetical protein
MIVKGGIDMKAKAKPMFKDWDEFVAWASCKILSAFIEEGGKGLRSSIYLVIHAHNAWENELKKEDNGIF